MSNIEIIDTIKPVNSQEFPVFEANDGKGGFHIAANTTARNAIDVRKRIEGLTCWVASNETAYRLVDGITNSDWEEVDDTSRYIHVETPASATWNIVHNLGRIPIVMCVDGATNGEAINGYIDHTSVNELNVRFSEAVLGAAILT